MWRKSISLIILISTLSACAVRPQMSVNYLTGSGGGSGDGWISFSHPFQ